VGCALTTKRQLAITYRSNCSLIAVAFMQKLQWEVMPTLVFYINLLSRLVYLRFDRYENISRSDTVIGKKFGRGDARLTETRLERSNPCAGDTCTRLKVSRCERCTHERVQKFHAVYKCC
jgi:hypothetical protein